MVNRIIKARNTPRPATLKDVADMVGVSQATVSYVLNGKAEARISEATRRRVLEAAAQLRYRPNALAVAMARGQSRTIGIYQTHVSESPLSGMWAAQVTRGIANALRDLGYHMLVYNYREPNEVDPVTFLDGRTDGLVILAPHAEDAVPCQLAQLGFPIAIIAGWPVDGEKAVCVDTDNVAGTRMATAYLTNLGHTRICHLAGPPDVPNAQDRLRGFQEAMEEHGLGDQMHIVQGGFSEAAGYAAAMTALHLRPRPTAILAANDIAALGTLKACAELGLRVPQDVSVMGFDDAPICTLTRPTLTTMRQPAAALGAEAARLVIAVGCGEPAVPRVKLLPPELIPRGSTASPNSQQGGDCRESSS
ncbi:MAG: LacI family DNA-binding transcriptional regulator [Chthonomonadales bacterium]